MSHAITTMVEGMNAMVPRRDETQDEKLATFVKTVLNVV
jgi:hypothetical protein